MATPSSYYEKDDIGEIEPIDVVLFELPAGWAWSRLSSCCCKEIKRGKSPKYAANSRALVFAQKCNTKYKGIDLSLAQFLDEETLSRYPQSEYLQNFDIVVNSTGTGTLGRVGFYQVENNPNELPVVPDSHVTTIRVSENLEALYIYSFMKHNQSYLESKGEGSTNQKELKPHALAELLIPIPPAKEQRRIAIAIKRTLEKIKKIH